jgi:DNA-binding MarR family transcriptional regulator
MDQQDELEFRVLRTLEGRPPMPLSAIASELLLPVQRVERVVSALVSRGLISQQSQPDNTVVFRLNDDELRSRVAAS